MNPPQILVIGAVAIGLVFLCVSLSLHLRAGRVIPQGIRPKWLLMAGLMFFFLIGYLFFLVLQLRQLDFPLELLTASVFLVGALFVLVVTKLTLRTLKQIFAHERELNAINIQLIEKNRDLEAEISRRKEAEKQVKIHLEHLTLLHDIDTMISASLDLGVTLKVFLDQLLPQLDIDAAAVLLFNAHTQRVEYAAGKGFHTDIITKASERLGQGSAGKTALERKVLYIADLSSPDNEYDRPEFLAAEKFVTYCALPLVAKGMVQGVLELYRRHPFEPDSEWLEFLQSLAIRTAIAIENALLFNKLQRSNSELILAYDTTIEGWSHALELRDHETEGHTQRVVKMTLDIARKFHMTEEQLVHVTRGALLHDIGKMAIPDEVLMKNGPLSESEKELMQHHPVYAMEMLSAISYLKPALDIPYCHHERWDGTGYPRGLKGTQIPLAARIFALADTWDALIHARRYHEAWPRNTVCDHIRERAGKHFDPEVVNVFMGMGWCRDEKSIWSEEETDVAI